MLEINPLSVVWFATIFSHSEGCLLISFIVSFAVQKLLSLIKSHLFIFVFISITLRGGQKGSCCDACQRFMLTYGRDKQNIIKQLSSNLKIMIGYISTTLSICPTLSFPHCV